MRFSITCILSLLLLVTSIAAIPHVGDRSTSLSRRDSLNDEVVELQARAKKAPAPHHPRAWGKPEKKLPVKSKDQRRDAHKAQVKVAAQRRLSDHKRKQQNLIKNGKPRATKNEKRGKKVARKQARVDKNVKVKANAKATQEKAKKALAERKKLGREKFQVVRSKYQKTDNLPGRKTTFKTPGGQTFSGGDVRRAVWNAHRFTGKPTNNKPAPFNNAAGPATNPHRIIKTMKGTGTEFPINTHKHGYQGRPQPVKTPGEKPKLENPGPARAIIQSKPNGRYSFRGVVSHDESKKGKGKQGGEHAHHQVFPQKPPRKK